MSNLIFRIWIDSGMSAMICRIRRQHSCLPSSYRDESCTRCSYIGPRSDWPR
jgi:hypothetical protein